VGGFVRHMRAAFNFAASHLMGGERQLWVDSGGSIVILRTAAIGASCSLPFAPAKVP
jgi:hypothetical protein